MAGSGRADSHERRKEDQQFLALADFVRRTRGHAHALAGFSQTPVLRRTRGIRRTSSPIRRFIGREIIGSGRKRLLTSDWATPGKFRGMIPDSGKRFLD